jgi:hypothetical protein
MRDLGIYFFTDSVNRLNYITGDPVIFWTMLFNLSLLRMISYSIDKHLAYN